jgi:hypothetical protein
MTAPRLAALLAVLSTTSCSFGMVQRPPGPNDSRQGYPEPCTLSYVPPALDLFWMIGYGTFAIRRLAGGAGTDEDASMIPLAISIPLVVVHGAAAALGFQWVGDCWESHPRWESGVAPPRAPPAITAQPPRRPTPELAPLIQPVPPSRPPVGP